MDRFSMKVAVLGVFFLAACGGGSTTNDELEPPIRTGGQLESTPITYYDMNPAISADGTKVVFVSGRDTTADGAQLRVYKAEWPTGDEPGDLERVTSDDLEGFEEDVVLSADGSTIGILVANNGVENLYTLPFAGGDLVQVTDDGAEKDKIVMSDDGAMLAYITVGDHTAYVVDAAGNKKVQVANDLGFVEALAFVPVDSGYKLALRVAAEESGYSTYYLGSFASVSAAESASFSSVGEAFVAKGDLVADDTRLLGSARVVPVGSEMVSRLGTKSLEDSPFSTPVETQPFIVAQSGGDTTEWEEAPGDAVKAFSPLSDGLGFLARHGYRCEGDPSTVFAWSIIAGDFGGSDFQRYYPLKAASGSWEVTDDVCSQEDSDGAGGTIDELVSDAMLAKDGTQAGFRGVYVTRFSGYKDAECESKAGDPEVRLIEVGTTSEIYDLSSNPYPDLSDSDRGDKGACS